MSFEAGLHKSLVDCLNVDISQIKKDALSCIGQLTYTEDVEQIKDLLNDTPIL